MKLSVHLNSRLPATMQRQRLGKLWAGWCCIIGFSQQPIAAAAATYPLPPQQQISVKRLRQTLQRHTYPSAAAKVS
jgi:hypothetical protein